MANDKTIERNERLAKAKNEGVEGKDFVTCQWCKEKIMRIYGRHMRSHPGKTSHDYKLEFPGMPLMAQKDKESIITTGDAHHMKKEEHRKRASEAWTGENNCNHSSKTTEQQRKELSPFSKEKYLKEGISEEDALKEVSKFAKEAIKNRISDTNIQYYLNLGQSNEEATESLANRQRTFSLEKCIEKFGEINGFDKWKKRQDKWKLKVFNDFQYIGGGKSKISKKLIGEIEMIFPEILHDKQEKFIRTKFDGFKYQTFKYDVCLKDKKKIIEFNGDFWHCNPSIKIYHPDYYHKIKKMTAQEIWDYDQLKKETAELYEYQILHIWESDYRKHPKETLQKCVDFLNS
jgi:hypothetical protein